jgi:hypothetical protein
MPSPFGKNEKKAWKKKWTDRKSVHDYKIEIRKNVAIPSNQVKAFQAWHGAWYLVHGKAFGVFLLHAPCSTLSLTL